MIEFVIKYRIFSYQDPKIENFLVIFWTFSVKRNEASKLIQKFSPAGCNIFFIWNLRQFFYLNLQSADKFARVIQNCFLLKSENKKTDIIWLYYNHNLWNFLEKQNKKIRVFSIWQKNFPEIWNEFLVFIGFL